MRVIIFYYCIFYGYIIIWSYWCFLCLHEWFSTQFEQTAPMHLIISNKFFSHRDAKHLFLFGYCWALLEQRFEPQTIPPNVNVLADRLGALWGDRKHFAIWMCYLSSPIYSARFHLSLVVLMRYVLKLIMCAT